MSSNIDALKAQWLAAERARSAPTEEETEKHLEAKKQIAEEGFQIAINASKTFDPRAAALGPTLAGRGQPAAQPYQGLAKPK